MDSAAAAQRIRAGGGPPRPAEGDPVAVRAPADRRRLGRHRRPDRRRHRGRRRQRPGLPGPRRDPRRAPELLPRQPGRTRAGRGRRGVPRPVLLGLALDAADDRRRPLPRRPGRAARRRRSASSAGRRSRSGSPSAATSGGCASSPSATPASPSTRTASAASTAASAGSTRSPTCARRWRWRSCRSGSRATTSPTSAPSTPSPRWSSSRAARRRSPTTAASGSAKRDRATATADDFAAMEEVLERRVNRYLEQADLSPHDGKRDESFASLPSLVVVDGGKGQLAAAMRALQPFVERGVTVASLAKREEEVFVPGSSVPIDLAADSEASKLAAAGPRRGAPVRDRTPPRPPRQGDDGLGARRDQGRRPGPQARPAPALRLARAVDRRQPRGTRGGARGSWQSGARHPRAAEQDRIDARTATDARVTMVVITGHSGAGKSEAIAAFEDGGYFCVDNLPPRMIGSLGELFRHPGSGVERAAVVSDVRGGDYFDDLIQVLDDLDADGLKPKVLFLEADEETLVDRYKETRRRHPLAPEGRIVEGIRAERELLSPLRARADVVMDTSDLTSGALRSRIARGAARQRRRRQARAHPAHLRLQERPAARRRPHPRRPLPAQPPLRRRAAAADRARRGGARVRRVRHPGRASSTAGCCRCSSSSSPPTSPRARAT